MNINNIRAWHKTEELMCKITTLTDNGAFLLGVKKGKNQYDGRTTVYAPEDGRFCTNEEITLMLSTQVRGTDNKEIFSGDICEYYDYFLNKLMIGGVRYIAGAWWFYNNGNVRSWSTLYTGIPLIPPIFPADFKVLGNIYQNPELLKNIS